MLGTESLLNQLWVRGHVQAMLNGPMRDDSDATSNLSTGAAQAHDRRWDVGSSVQLQTRCGRNTLRPMPAKAVP
jgi:hypothetical protein